jgi:nucleoside-diphosphate-sugar epimerase
VYDNLLYERQYLKDVQFHYGDIRERHKLLRLIEGEDFDVIVWLAAIVGDPACKLNPELTKEINQDSVEWLASVAGDRRIIFMSSCSVYGQASRGTLLDEDAGTNPLSEYAITKLAAEKFLKDKNAVIFRLGTVYGLGDKFARPRFDLVVNIMTANMVRNNKLTVHGGDQMRPLVHVKDIARVIAHAVIRDMTGVYNVAQYNLRIDEIAQTIKDTLGYGEIEITEREGDGMDARDYAASTEKFRRDFDIRFQYSLERAIAEIAAAVESRRIKNHRDKVFNNMLNIKEKLSE